MNTQIAPWHAALLSAENHFTTIAAQRRMLRWAEESEFALHALRTNDKLRACAPESIRAAVIHVAATGITLNPAQKLAYLVPHDGIAQLYVSFRGLVSAAVSTGAIADAAAYVVHEGDDFEPRGPHEAPHWIERGDPKGREVVAAVSVARLNNGMVRAEVMWRSDIDKIRDCAKTRKVWDRWYEEMAKKAVTKRAAKYWPEIPRAFAEVIQTLNDIEGGVEPVAQPTAEQRQATIAQVNELKTLIQRLFPQTWQSVQRKMLAAYGVRLVSHLSPEQLVDATKRIHLLHTRAEALRAQRAEAANA